MAFWDNLLNVVTNSWDPASLFGFGHGHSASSSATGTGSILGDTWDKFKNGNVNDVNWNISQENLGYQRERNAIEDARYEEERDYNRAWAEEEREYSRALQQQIFDREDTAASRQAADLASIGINPLSQNMNGFGSGTPVTSSTAPTDSTRGGTALHNDFQMQDTGMLPVLSTLSSLYQGLESVKEGKARRDSLLLENDKKRIENMKRLFDLGFDVEDFDKLSLDNPYVASQKGSVWKNQNFDSYFKEFQSKLAGRQYDVLDRDFKEMKNRGVFGFDPDFIKNAKYFASDDFQDLFEKILTKGSAMADDLFTKLSDGKSYKDSKLKKFFDFFL